MEVFWKHLQRHVEDTTCHLVLAMSQRESENGFCESAFSNLCRTEAKDVEESGFQKDVGVDVSVVVGVEETLRLVEQRSDGRKTEGVHAVDEEDEREQLEVGGDMCGGVGEESAESGGVREEEGGEAELGVEDGRHVAEESQLSQLRVATSVVRREQNHVHGRVLRTRCFSGVLIIQSTENAATTCVDGKGS